MTRIYNINQLLSTLLLIGVLAGCGSEDVTPAPTAQEEVSAMLTSGPWRLDMVTVDGANRTEVYRDLTLNFTNSTYSATNGGIVWPANGLWAFQNQEATIITRGDGVQVTIQDLTEQALRLSLYWDTNTLRSARVYSIEGQHVFSFVR